MSAQFLRYPTVSAGKELWRKDVGAAVTCTYPASEPLPHSKGSVVPGLMRTFSKERKKWRLTVRSDAPNLGLGWPRRRCAAPSR